MTKISRMAIAVLALILITSSLALAEGDRIPSDGETYGKGNTTWSSATTFPKNGATLDSVTTPYLVMDYLTDIYWVYSGCPFGMDSGVNGAGFTRMTDHNGNLYSVDNVFASTELFQDGFLLTRNREDASNSHSATAWVSVYGYGCFGLIGRTFEAFSEHSFSDATFGSLYATSSDGF